MPSQEGHIKVWRVRTGQCVRRFHKAHAQGVTCLSFSLDNTLVASGSFDAVGRVHGLKSGKTLKELRGHTSYINSIVYAPEGARIVSGSSDGCVRVWDAKTAECTAKFQPPTAVVCRSPSLRQRARAHVHAPARCAPARSPHARARGPDSWRRRVVFVAGGCGGEHQRCGLPSLECGSSRRV